MSDRVLSSSSLSLSSLIFDKDNTIIEHYPLSINDTIDVRHFQILVNRKIVATEVLDSMAIHNMYVYTYIKYHDI